ncbi:MAG: plasmid pRiA4b ORF-3 family protein [Planctomycetota bacterium]
MVYQIKVTLLDSEPPIWRRILVSETTKLSRFNEIIQGAMGWYNCHLHEFIAEDETRYGAKVSEFGMDLGDDEDVVNERKVALSTVLKNEGDTIAYIYDMGDSWEHRVELEKVLPDDDRLRECPTCLDGKRACPPEDCGGIFRFYELLKILKDPKHQEHAEMTEWLGEPFDPVKFDPGIVNIFLKQFRTRGKAKKAT